MTVLVVSNQKGGSGKTTIAANLAGALCEAGARVLAVDMDSQAQLAAALGAQDALTYSDDGLLESLTIADLLNGAGRGPVPSIADVVIHTPFPGLDLLPASDRLEDARRALESNPALGLGALRRVLAPANLAAAGLEYDWIVVDTAPKLDILLDNSLVAGDFVLAVLAPEMQQAEPLSRFVGRVAGVQETMRPDLKLLGVLFNKANYSWVATNQIPSMLAEMGLPVLDTIIPMYSRLANGYGNGPVTLTAPNSREAGVIRTAAQELMARVAAEFASGVPA